MAQHGKVVPRSDDNWTIAPAYRALAAMRCRRRRGLSAPSALHSRTLNFGDASMSFQHHEVQARTLFRDNTLLRLATTTPKHRRRFLAALAFVLAGCNQDSPFQAETHLSHHGGLVLSSLSGPAVAPTLDALRQNTAAFHDVDAALAAGYTLFIDSPRTAADGCISSAADGGMGYHYGRLDNLADGSVTLLDPEFLVYAPKDGPSRDGEARRRLAAFDYFILYSARWPAPSDPNFKRAPSLHDFSTMSALPDIAFAPSRFGGWMVHIWLWEQNPGGMFANWNRSVPLCEGSVF